VWVPRLQDHYDVKMPAHLLLGKLAGRAPAYVVAVLDRLVPPLQKTLTAKLKADAVKQEVGRMLVLVVAS
jgi:cullin-associated NEDD8-dissociated protein 1